MPYRLYDCDKQLQWRRYYRSLLHEVCDVILVGEVGFANHYTATFVTQIS